MGSRAVLLVCRSAAGRGRARFGVVPGAPAPSGPGPGGRSSPARADRGAARPASARRPRRPGCSPSSTRPGCSSTPSCCPWTSRPAQLLRDQYAAVGAAARASLPAAVSALEQAAARGLPDVGELLDRTRSRRANADAFTAAYRRYCWPTDGLAGVRVAPFQLLATEGAVYHDRPHLWHLALADRLAAADPELISPTRRIVAPIPAIRAAATAWWEELTAAGGEGMVVKPAANLTRGAKGLVQPGLKVRGREYLRIIYGPDYTEPANLTRLRQRALSHKRSLALREYALGLEALDRVAGGEPLWRVHECVFAVLALESEPVDPRL